MSERRFLEIGHRPHSFRIVNTATMNTFLKIRHNWRRLEKSTMLGGDYTCNLSAASFGGACCLGYPSSIVKRTSFISLISVITIA